MSTEGRTLALINAITAGRKAPRYEEFAGSGVSRATYITYVDKATRLRSFFGPSDQSFTSIGQMRRLSHLCAGKKKIAILSKIPMAADIPKASLIHLIEHVNPLLSDSEIVRGFVMLPDIAGAKKMNEISSMASFLIYKLYMLNVTTFDALVPIADPELLSGYERTMEKWGEYLCPDFDRHSGYKFWVVLFGMVHYVACSKVKDPDLRTELIRYNGQIAVFRNGIHRGADAAIRNAIQNGRHA